MAFQIQSTTERIESIGGIALIGEIARSSGLCQSMGNRRSLGTAVMSMFGLLALGRSRFKEIEAYRGNRLFRHSLGLSFVPAAETLRLYLEKLAEEGDIRERIRRCNQVLLARTAMRTVEVEGRRYLPVDVDVSILDNTGSHKEGVSRTYQGTDGYAPLFSYIGAEGYMLDCELRPGSQHCQKGTPAFLRRNLSTIRALRPAHPVLFRLDGGHDALDTIQVLLEAKEGNTFFILKRNLRRESTEYWREVAQTLGEKRIDPTGTVVYTGTLTRAHPLAEPGMPELDIVFQVTERTIDRQGNPLLVAELEVETWWTNLYERAEAIIELYHAHGTSEQFHSELKYDMGVERLPSGKMKVNALILTIAMMAFNALRWIGQRSLAKPDVLPVQTDVMRKRIRKILSDLIYIGCKVVSHGRRWILRIHKRNPWLPVFRELYAELQLT